MNGLSLYLTDVAVLNDASLLKHALQTWGITTLFTATSLCSRRVQEDPAVFASLKYLLIGGEELRPALSNTIRSASPGLRVSNVYGPTEGTTFAISFAVEGEYSSRIPIGKPIRGRRHSSSTRRCSRCRMGASAKSCWVAKAWREAI